MISEYLKERAKWKKFGKPLRTQEEMDEIFSICSPCTQYKKFSDEKGECAVCGCHIKKTGTFLNKIAWGTTRCPLPEPKWTESKPAYRKDPILNHNDLTIAEIEHKEELAQNIEDNKEPTPPCNCK